MTIYLFNLISRFLVMECTLDQNASLDYVHLVATFIYLDVANFNHELYLILS